MRRTSPVALALLVAVGLVAGRAIRIVVENLGWIVPSVPWTAPVALFFVAAILGTLAWSTYQALHRDRRRMQSDRAVRLLALAKSCAVVGALVLGGYLGFALSYVDSMDAALPRERVVRSLVAAVGAALVLVASLLLERACEVPKDPDDEKAGPGDSARA
ncbi:DUF3180 domain-containing protein [Solicola sp. PLA-1-18]|uniref:DUF3180 domain-containing protein n=1 Tax=Solicola sp. PLA-1-18 TaxID=3380532 RepID=UPI003B7C8D9B